jgi:hypothetical protein
MPAGALTRWLALAVLATTVLIANLDNTVLDVTLPTLTPERPANRERGARFQGRPYTFNQESWRPKIIYRGSDQLTVLFAESGRRPT